MTEAINMTYENNVFYCTKNGTKWISIDGEKWYGEEKRIEELEKKIKRVRYTLNKIIETVHNDRIDEYGARLVLIKDFAYECLQEIEK